MNTTSSTIQPPPFADSSLPLAVVVASTAWSETPRMRHQVARQLMRWCNVLFVEFFPARRTTGEFQQRDGRLIVYAPKTQRLPPVRVYANVPMVHRRTNRSYVDSIERVVGQFPARKRLLVSFVYDFPEIMESTVFDHKTYVCYDEFPRMWRREKQPNAVKFLYQSRLYQRYENEVARQADRCVACHTPLVDKLRPVNAHSALFMHGHEFKGTPVQPANSGPKPIRVGFMGYITYNLLQSWLYAVLDETDMELNLIGPIDKFDPTPFEQYGNFTHISPVTGESLLKALASMDVLVMPYNPEIPEVHVQTASNKFFQYVAACRPVVISDMPHYVAMPEGVLYRARTADEFVEAIRRAYDEDCDAYRELRAQIAAANTWDKRGDQLRESIEQDLREKGKGLTLPTTKDAPDE